MPWKIPGKEQFFVHGNDKMNSLICSSSLLLVEGIIVLMLTAGNLALCVREERLRRTEMVRSVKDQLSNHDGKKS